MRDTEIDLTDTPSDMEFECPRCRRVVTERLYGPCRQCAEQLRAVIVGQRDDDAAMPEFEPKMNVTPNAVGLKDD